MAKNQSRWQVVSLTPLSGPLDARQRPTEAPDGGFYAKLNFNVSQNGILSRLAGVEKFLSQSPYGNWDFHDRTSPRKPLTSGWEITSSAGDRFLIVGDENNLWRLDEAAGTWTNIATGMGSAGAKWHADVLQDVIIFSNNVDPVVSYDLSGGMVAAIPELTNASPGGNGVTKAKVVIQYLGVILVMNLEQDSAAQPSRVMYSDLNKPKNWLSAGAGGDSDSIAGFQDLDYGEEILAAAQLQGNLMIYTNKSIWRAYISVDSQANTIFGFVKVYTEPKNQAGCLVYPDSLISTGDAHYYGARESIYTYNPYLTAPEKSDWLWQASGLIYTAIDPSCCLSMCAEYRPNTKEIFISWPTVSKDHPCINTHTLVLNVEYKTGHDMDTGFSMFTNFKPATAGGGDCNTKQVLVGASTTDYSLKSVADSFTREFLAAGDPTVNVTTPVYRITGYTSRLLGIFPLGLTDLMKYVRKVTLGQFTVPQAQPCIARLRIGSSFHFVNPSLAKCDIVWRTVGDVPLKCSEPLNTGNLNAQNLIPSLDCHWDCYEQGRFLYFDITILNADGSPAKGADTHWHKLDAEIMALP